MQSLRARQLRYLATRTWIPGITCLVVGLTQDQPVLLYVAAALILGVEVGAWRRALDERDEAKQLSHLIVSALSILPIGTAGACLALAISAVADSARIDARTWFLFGLTVGTLSALTDLVGWLVLRRRARRAT